MVVFKRVLWLLTSVSSSLCALLPALDASSVDRRDISLSASFNVNTDFDLTFPTTSKVVPYTLVITNTTCNLDGSPQARTCLLVNGQYPGPTIRARWGDTVQVTVVNKMQDNGTSIHFHGVRQLNTPGSDGVNGVTQCAIAPGDSATYSFQATQHGTSWYHSHTSVQYGEGVAGPIVFDGPAAVGYDADLGPYFLNDWYGNQTAWQAATVSQGFLDNLQGPQQPTSILINGTTCKNSTSDVVRVQRGKKYRLRLINAGTYTYLRVSLDGHSMRVIANDFVPVRPYTTKWLLLGIGQRYDVIITATQSSGSFWFRANFPYSCYGQEGTNGTAIWTYDATPSIPSSKPNSPEPYDCNDESFAPLWPGSVPPATFANSIGVGVAPYVTPEGHNMVVWELGNYIRTNYSDPTIGYLMRGDTNYPKLYNVLNTSAPGQWNYWLILNNGPMLPPIPHPIHLHGHDFYVVGSGVGAFNQATAKLNWRNPIRRDTQSVPSAGWLALAFKSDNPGAWLMHCHIAFHIAEGFGVQYVEKSNSIHYPDLAQYSRTCSNWRKYQAGEKYSELQDSGL